MHKKQAEELLNKYKLGQCSEAELAQLESWYLEYKEETPYNFTEEQLASAKHAVWASLPVHQSKQILTVKFKRYIAIAASLIVIASAWLVIKPGHKNGSDAFANAKIVPGGNKAILTLADGSKISLNASANGALAKQAGMEVVKTKDGQLVYQVLAGTNAKTEKIGYNTISTPRGGMYQVNLPDGTKAWLNAASSLTFPTAFTGNERKVQLTGEGYFEVVHNADMPFRVVSKQQTVEVLGTHFDVNAYTDEANAKTTLIKGKVKITTSEGGSALLSPGEQAVILSDNIKVNKVDTSDDIAWVNNKFVFNNETLGVILRKISRWYDVDFDYPPELEKLQYNGVVSRTKDINHALKIIESTGDVHFKIEGRRITVMR